VTGPEKVTGPEILTVAEMGEADRLAVDAGVPSLKLMESAGAHVAREVIKRAPRAGVAVLCGPGNNGGDGYVAARLLKEKGHKVWVETYGDPAKLKGDALEMYRRWDGETRPISAERNGEIIVDALFGAGISRPLEEDLYDVVAALNMSDAPVIAVDVPSGLLGDSGKPFGEICVRAAATVTFFRKKPGHLLMPGRIYCGETCLADIGIPEKVLETICPKAFENGPDLWGPMFTLPKRDGHKYTRGHALVLCGPAHTTGAARLAARGALRVGAGLVTIASPSEAVSVNAAHLTAIMIRQCDNPQQLAALLEDKRLNAVALGPGLGVGAATKDFVFSVLESGASAVLDADALTSFSNDQAALFAKRLDRAVLTPHQGEFERLFPGLLQEFDSRLMAARKAAVIANCIVVLKGANTIVAAPDGRAAINTNAPPWLATAGAGDVLAGFVVGLLSQGVPAFEAAACAVWLHGEAAAYFGLGLVAEDLPEMLPDVLQDLRTLA